MLLEIRTYRLLPGVRDEFVAWFQANARPAMEAAELPVIGPFVSSEDPDVFVYLRTFTDREDRERRCDAFYSSTVWTEQLRDRALAMEHGFEVRLLESTPGGTVLTNTAES
jgi:hypothetical protein